MKPIWPYAFDDKTTWKYIAVEILGHKEGEYVTRWIENPNFAYKDREKAYYDNQNRQLSRVATRAVKVNVQDSAA